MKTIISKRHIFKFYFSLVLGTMFLLAMATACLFKYNKDLNEGMVNPKGIILPIISAGIYAFAGYSFYRYFKNSPTITLDKNYIKFNNQTYSLNDIKNVELTGKCSFRYLINFQMEAATLIFNNGETKYIFDDMYSNTWEIKSFIKQVVVDKKQFFEPIENIIDRNSLVNEYFETYKGTVLTSLRGISLWGLIGFFGFIILNVKKSIPFGASLFFTGYSTFWFLLHSYLMNYFQVSDNYFVVRNQNFFWTKKVYYLNEIMEVVFETQGNAPNCLKVINKNYKNKLYPAGTLRDKSWLELQDKLELHNIKVRNECI